MAELKITVSMEEEGLGSVGLSQECLVGSIRSLDAEEAEFLWAVTQSLLDKAIVGMVTLGKER